MIKLLEINAAEGGDDSKLFVSDLTDAYIKLANRFG
jgi:protein subunit release factor A